MLHFGNIPIIKTELRDITQMTNCYTLHNTTIPSGPLKSTPQIL